MMLLPLTQGRVALVDDEDAPLAACRWHAHRSRANGTWYARGSVRDGSRVLHPRLHREVWARMHPGQPLPDQIDHANGDGLDCRRGNLRPATPLENGANMRRRRDSTSGFKGVVAQRGRWRARIRVRYGLIHLGIFDDPRAAARAYDAAARLHFGAFAALNFPHPHERAA